MLSKDEFIKALDEVEKVNKYNEELNSVFRKNGVDGYIFQPDCTATVLRLLHILFEKADKDEWIEYFCYELDFGKNWKSGIIINKDGSDIKLGTSEDLYNYLCTLMME